MTTRAKKQKTKTTKTKSLMTKADTKAVLKRVEKLRRKFGRKHAKAVEATASMSDAGEIAALIDEMCALSREMTLEIQALIPQGDA